MNVCQISKVIFIVFIVCLFVAGCGQETAEPTAVVKVPPTSTPEPVDTATAVPTATLTLEPTATLTPEPTATNAPIPTDTPDPTPTNTPTPDKQSLFDEKMAEARNYADNAEWNRAKTAFAEALDLDPESSRAYYNLGHTHLELGDTSQAIENFNKAIELDPQNAVYYMDRGNAHGESGNLAAAVEDYTKAIELDPADARFYFNRALVYKTQGEYDLALADYDQAILHDPEFAYAYHNRANVYWMLDDLDNALADFDRGLELDPEDHLGYLNRASLHEEMGNLEASLADLNEAVALLGPDFITVTGATVSTIWADGEGFEENWLFALTMRAHINHQLGNYALANDDIEMAASANPTITFDIFDDDLSRNPGRGLSLFGRGRASTHQEDLDAAMEDYTQAINNSSNDPMRQYYYLQRGILFVLNGAYDQALADWEQVTQIAPDNTKAYLFLGLIQGQMGDYEAGIDSLTTGLQANPPEEDLPGYAEGLVNNAGMLTPNVSDPRQMEVVIDTYDFVATEFPEFEILDFHYNNLCWYGSLWGYVEDVFYACELAVEMDTEDGGKRDTRGLARALTGDFAGAIEDFQAFIEWGPENDVPSEAIERRKLWIAALEAGSNPFDAVMLELLRDE